MTRTVERGSSEATTSDDTGGPAFDPVESERNTIARPSSDSLGTTDDHLSRSAWKVRCPACDQLIKATARRCECGLEYPAMSMVGYYADGRGLNTDSGTRTQEGRNA